MPRLHYKSLSRAVLALLACGALACSGGSAATVKSAAVSSGISSADSTYSASGPNGAVASEHPLASQAGLEILKAGGNAIDAAVAATLANGVVNPSSSGLGGGGFAVFYLADQQRAVAFDFREAAPGAAHRDLFVRDGELIPAASMRGGLAVAVPGEPLGMEQALRRFGTMSPAQVTAPALKLARQGFPIGRHLANMIVKNQAALAGSTELAAVLLHADGSPRGEGETLRRPDLARTLEAFSAQGAAPFYRGEIAADIVAAVGKGGGILTADDLASYRVIEREPTRSGLGNYQVLGMPPPSSGGGTIAVALAVLGDYDFGGGAAGVGAGATPQPKAGFKLPSSFTPETPDYVHTLTETLKAVFADRALYYGDADQVAVPLDRLLSPAHAQEIGKAIDPQHATPADRWGNAESPRDSGTTHISVVDQAGNAAALTSSVNTAFGAKLSVPGRDLLLNNTMDDFSLRPGVPNYFGLVGSETNAVAANKRPLSSMSPTVVLEDGNVRLVAGGAGGPLIITGTLQTVLGVLVFEQSVAQSVAAPRIHHQWRPDVLEVEEAAPSSLRSELQRRGHKVEERHFTSSVQAVEVINDNGQRTVHAASDPRKSGQAAAY